MRLLTWNIQCGLGCDGRVDLARIAEVARAMGDPDVLCLQEVSKAYPPASETADQVAELAALFPEHTAVFGPAVETADENGRPRAFGNLVLSRFPVLRVERHLLPWPPGDGARSMRRQALLALLQTLRGPLHVLTTHLEFHLHAHRAAQVRRLLGIVAEAMQHDEQIDGDLSQTPYRSSPRAVGLVLTGDFNFGPDDDLHSQMGSGDGGAPRLQDAWAAAHPGRDHAPTCGIFDHVQWPEGAHCRDFIWLTPELKERLADVNVDVETDASDHQPVAAAFR